MTAGGLRLWRISNYADLSGNGGLRYSARWHSKGCPVIYAADHPAGALIETLVHLDLDNLPEHYQLVTIAVEGEVRNSAVEESKLPADWTTDTQSTRSIGDSWLGAGTSLLLRVPSAIMPGASNMLINPRHRDAARLRIEKIEKFPLDDRLAHR